MHPFRTHSALILSAALGIPPDEVTVFGDNCSDLSMLRMVGRPCLMETAGPALRPGFALCRRVEEVLAEGQNLPTTAFPGKYVQ